MSEMRIKNPDDLVVCPYEKAHLIRASRMQYHLIKCRKQHDTTEFVSCPFNATHEVLKTEARYHYAICPDRTRITQSQAYEEQGETGLKGCTDLPAYKPDIAFHFQDENWEEEIASNPRVGVDASLLEQRQHYLLPNPQAPVSGQSEGTQSYLALDRRQQYFQRRDAAANQQEGTQQLRRPQNPSQAYAMHIERQQQQQQLEQQPQPDIYQLVLNRQANGAMMAAGRGRGNPLSQGSAASQQVSQVGCHGDGRGAAGRGRGRGVLGLVPDLDKRLAFAGPGPAAVGRGTPAPVSHSALEKGSVMNQLGDAVIPPSQVQPAAYSSGVSAVGVGGGQAPTMGGSFNPEGLPASAVADPDDSENVSGEQFEDVPDWVGGGYDSPASSSTLSGEFGSNGHRVRPPNTQTFAPHTSSSNSSVGSELSGSDASNTSTAMDVQKSLKKVRKLLRQIDGLERKKLQGVKLNFAEESKIGRKVTLEKQEVDLLNQLQTLSVS